MTLDMHGCQLNVSRTFSLAFFTKWLLRSTLIELLAHLLGLVVGLLRTKLSVLVEVCGNRDGIGIKICSIALEMLLRTCKIRLALIMRVAYKLVLLA